MHVIGVDTKKMTKTKKVLIVTQSLKNSTMQMYSTSLEPNYGLGQRADLSILIVIKYTLPQAKSPHDIGVRVMSAAGITRAMLADFNSMKGGSVFNTTHVDSLDDETSERNPFTIFDQYVTQSVIPKPLLILNTMAKPCVAPCAQNGSNVKAFRCKGFGVEASFRKSYGHLSLPGIELSVLASTTRLKEKDKCKV